MPQSDPKVTKSDQKCRHGEGERASGPPSRRRSSSQLLEMVMNMKLAEAERMNAANEVFEDATRRRTQVG
eukprot:9256475-Pyramimonas_sp.AAC.1